ncbi:hypothetical protein TWF481_003765 [Arthrobotrys musiformis]|uniref:Aminoglycoside phosphotransferase domain-containing protein n=1 Tax=Arthrobotrys musiformis TaxID=47236 RepID=A0AAV9WHH1_9PEZI
MEPQRRCPPPALGDDNRILLRPSDFPAAENVDFLETAFFRADKSRKLPTPSEVRSRAPDSGTYRPFLIWFTENGMNLVVKWGDYITIAEGQVYWMLKKKLKEEIPTPEIYGWRTQGGQVFLYLECTDGLQLEEVYGQLDHSDKMELAGQIKKFKAALGRLYQDPQERFLGSIGGQPLQDVVCEPYKKISGPHKTISSLHDQILREIATTFPDRDPQNPRKINLPDHVSIVLSHCDLDPKNILVSRTNPRKVIALIDWHQSGWYPSYWEWCKAKWCGGEWGRKYLVEEALENQEGSEADFRAFVDFTRLLGVC